MKFHLFEVVLSPPSNTSALIKQPITWLENEYTPLFHTMFNGQRRGNCENDLIKENYPSTPLSISLVLYPLP